MRRKKKGEKERARRKKGGEGKKNNGCTLSCYNGYFGGNGLKTPARYI